MVKFTLFAVSLSLLAVIVVRLVNKRWGQRHVQVTPVVEGLGFVVVISLLCLGATFLISQEQQYNRCKEVGEINNDVRTVLINIINGVERAFGVDVPQPVQTFLADINADIDTLLSHQDTTKCERFFQF